MFTRHCILLAKAAAAGGKFEALILAKVILDEGLESVFFVALRDHALVLELDH